MSDAGADPSTLLLAVSGLLSREVAVEDLLDRLVERVAAAMDADRATIYLVDGRSQEVFSQAAHLPELDEIRLPLGQGIAGWVAKTGEIVNAPTTSGHDRFFSGVDEQTGYRTTSTLAVPMRDRQGEIIGVLQLLNKKSGAFDVGDQDTLILLANQASLAIQATTLYEDLSRAPAEDTTPLPLADRFNLVVGESSLLRAACKLIKKAAPTEATVLIRGESGTGKGLFARALAVNSRRRDGPFVKVDCAALPASVIDNELFGHEKGAYTGADERADGKVDAAGGGTLFLDEIGELPMQVQGKLLRLIQDREFQRVGGNTTVTADVRIVAATNRDLEQMIEEQTFRADLYYRIKVVEVSLPPLRDRGASDAVRLARHFLGSAARRNGRLPPRLSDAAVERLTAYPWPGNVRELENCIESAVIIMDGDVLRPEHLPLPQAPRLAPPPPQADDEIETLAAVERRHIVAVLERCDGNRTQAARLLGIGRNTLGRKLKALGLSARPERD